MEVNTRKAIQIEIDGKEYTFGFFTRKDIKIAEKKGLRINRIDEEVVTQTDKLFYTALLSKQPDITEAKADELIEKFVGEGGDLKDILSFLAEQITNFMQFQNGKTKKKEIKIIEI